MGNYQVTFLGLMNFHNLSASGVRVLLPNGIRFGRDIPDHFARLFLKTDCVQRQSDWWAPIPNEIMDAVGVSLYPIPVWCDLSITPLDEAGYFDPSRFVHVPPLANVEIDPAQADTIAQLPIRQGTLVSHQIAQSEVATLTVDYGEPIVITASPIDGSAAKRLVLDGGTEVVLSNMSNLFAGHPAEGGPSHYKIYSELDRLRRDENVEEPGDIHPDLPFLFPNGSRHPFVEWIHNNFGNIPRPGCGIST